MIDQAKIVSALRSSTTKKYGLRALVAFFVIGILGFFVLPPFVKSILLEKLGEALHREVTVQRVSINPYTLSLQVDGVAIQEKGGGDTVASFDSLYVNLETSSLFRGGPVVSEIRLVSPKVKIVRLADKRYNFSDLIDEILAKPPSDAPTPPFSLNNIQISGGSVDFDDRPVDEKHVISEINLTLPFVSSLAYATETFVEPAFSAKINGASLAMKGKSKIFAESRESELTLDLDNLQLAKYFDYAPVHVPVKIISGALDGDLKIAFRQENNKPSTLALSGTAALKELLIKDAGDVPLVSFKRLDLMLGSADLLQQKLVIDRVLLDAPEIHARVGRQGSINWLDLLPKTQDAGPAAAPKSPLSWSITEAKVTGGALHWLDESSGKAVRASIEGLDLDLRKLDSQSTGPAEFDVAYRVSAEPWLKVDVFSIKSGQLNLAKREVVLGDVSLGGTRMLVRRAADGSIEWLKPPTLRAVQSAQKEAKKQDKTPWKITVAKYHGENIGLRFEDKTFSPVAVNVIEGLGIDIENLSLEPGQVAKIATRFKLNGKGAIEIGGAVTLSPLDADLKLDVKAVELLPLQPYFTEKLNVAVTRGQVTLDGGLQVKQKAPAAVGELALTGGFSGKATIGDFNAVDKINSADFLKWKSLYFGNVDLRLGPDSVSVGEIALSDFFARIIVSPQGKLNLLQIVRKNDQSTAVSVAPEATAEPVATAAVESADGKAAVPLAVAVKPQMPVKIGKVTLQGGNVNFSDNFVKPNYSARLKSVGGRISGLSSAPDSIANLELRGNYDNVAPLNITAKINPLSAKPYLDLQADIKGIELTSLSAYSGKYAGYAIEKGKLSLFVKYKIENSQLEAENRIFIDQLTFGAPVESADATKLPVSLAVSLLKNRNGEIDLNLPISGSLDDPQFSVGGLVVQVIVNLFVKAVTSPFALLGSLFGGGEELSNVEFEYGRAALTPAALTRLENLAKALVDRPTLKLEVEGRVDVERDPEGLKGARIDRKVKALKREDMTKKAVESGSADEIEVTAKEYPELLERVYRAEKFPKPRNLVGMVKTLPVEEMEKLILTNSVVDEEDLRGLGDRRAKAVRDWLVSHEVPAERVFMLPVRLGDAAAKPGVSDKAKGSRVDFSLK